MFISIASIHIAKNLINGSTLIAGASLGTYFFLRGFTSIISPYFQKKVNNKNKILIIISCISTISLSFLLLSFITNANLVIIPLGMIGVSLGTLTPIKNTFFSQHLDKNKEVRSWGLLDGLGLISVGIASYLGSYITDAIGFPNLLRISSTGILFSALPLLLVIHHLHNKTKYDN